MAHLVSPAVEAVGFTALVLLHIWVFRARWPWTVWIVASIALALWRRPCHPAPKTQDPLCDAVRRRALWWILGAAAAVAIGRTPAAAVEYWAWCVIQQAALQYVIQARLRAPWASGALFALVHLPNPVLAPATFFWGALSCRLFERWPNLPVLALAQAVLSWALLAATPRDWHHNFRVGTGYFDWSSSSHTPTSLSARVLHP
jgi:hypothetical protein